MASVVSKNALTHTVREFLHLMQLPLIRTRTLIRIDINQFRATEWVAGLRIAEKASWDILRMP